MRMVYPTAAATALVGAVVLLVAPLYESGQTLIEANGAGIAWVIVVPLALALLPLALSGESRRAAMWAAAIALLLLSLLSSAGIFFLPAALMLALAAHQARAPREG